jgi:D-cysteine desulfhydrase
MKRAKINYPARITLANLPTPLVKLERLSATLGGVTVWVKRDEMTGVEVSGNKLRKLEFCIAEAQRQGCDTLITCGGLQSNHCRATAIMGARLGMKVQLILRGEEPEVASGNLLMDRLAGAQISYLPAEGWASAHPQYAAQLQAEAEVAGSKAYFIPTGASDEVGLWGYIAASEELAADFAAADLRPDALVCATGSGGTQAGLIAGNALFDLAEQVVAFNVSDNAAYFEERAQHDISAWQQRYADILAGTPAADLKVSELAVNTQEAYLGPGYGIGYPEVFETIKTVAACEGLFLDPVYTGKAFYGMLNEIRKGADGCFAGARNIVFVHTGGLFGVFPQQDQFTFDD